MSNLVVSLPLSEMALTEESIEKLRQQYKTKKSDPMFEPECTIKLSMKTVNALKELSRHNNAETWEQIIMRLIRSYNTKESQ